MKSCLVVEDSPIIREIACRLIREIGLEALDAENAGDAVEMCRDNNLDVVLLDWDLPSMGALDFLRGAANLDADKKPAIILCATENDIQQFTLARAAGAAHHVLKPFDRRSLEEIFAEIGLIEAPANAKADPKITSITG